MEGIELPQIHESVGAIEPDQAPIEALPIILAGKHFHELVKLQLLSWDESKIPVMTCPIKKRINTELFIDRKQGLYTKTVGLIFLQNWRE